MNVAFWDIETEAIPVTGTSDIKIVYAIGVKVNDGPVKKFTKYYLDCSDGPLQKGIELINNADVNVTFNGINFDIPVVERVLNTKITSKSLDLMLMSKVMFTKDNLYAVDPKLMPEEPYLWGSFSLKAFGKRIGKSQKDEFEDWSKLSSAMVNYMVSDVNVTKDIYDFFVGMDSIPTDKVMALEHNVARIIQEQETLGFMFNLPKARELNAKLNLEKFRIEFKLAKVFKAKFLKDGKVQKTNKMIKRKTYLPNTKYKTKALPLYWPRPWKKLKNGKLRLPAKTKLKYFAEPMRVVITEKNGEYQNIKLTKFTATDNQIKIWLEAMVGFTFTTYTDKGNVRVDRDDLVALADKLVAEAKTDKEKDTADAITTLRRLMKVKKDISQLHGDKGLIPSYRAKSGTITSRIDTNGTVTGRFTSSGGNPKTFKSGDASKGVNLNQIPSQAEFRELFDSPTYYTVSDELAVKLKQYMPKELKYEANSLRV